MHGATKKLDGRKLENLFSARYLGNNLRPPRKRRRKVAAANSRKNYTHGEVPERKQARELIGRVVGRKGVTNT